LNVKKISNITFILIVFLFIQSRGNSLAQPAAEKEKTEKVNTKGTGPETFANITSPDDDISKQSKKEGVKKDPVKQIRSARPDMTKSRGARPPDIVRPSGSRIPKGVGRPAGAVMHGR
jgi:hypothetical protein